jgi:glycylpeptide N-tetradecanoyltransferase
MPRSGKGKKKAATKKGKKPATSAASKGDADADKKSADAEDGEEEPDVADMLMSRGRRRWEVDAEATHVFWDTQPVPTLSEKIAADENEPMEVKTLDDVRKEPLLLPAAFTWVELDLRKEAELDELYVLLRDHYVEDDDAMFRFNYSPAFLQWALMVPHYHSEWHIGIRHVASGTLMAFISGIPAHVHVKDKDFPITEINFLCIHEKLRGKRLAPVLIKEVTRRVNCRNVWQAVYTAGVVLPKPIAKTRYWHRSLNPMKLIDIGFSSSRRRVSRLALKKLYTMPKKPSIPTIRKMRHSDCVQVHKILVKYLEKFPFRIRWTLDDVKHFLMPVDNVVYSYVITASKDKKSTSDAADDADDKSAVEVEDASDEEEITDFISFYNLPSQVMKHEKYDEMRAAYSYYNVPNQYTMKELVTNALIMAQSEGFDLYNCLDLMDNSEFLGDKSMKFGIGDGRLQYYVYNWKTSELQAKDVAIVLV